MSQTIVTPSGPVAYDERPDSPRETYAQGVYQVHRVFDVAWAQRWSFLLALLGDSAVGAGGAHGSYVRRTTPAGYPTPLGNGANADLWIYPTGVDSVEPIGGDQGFDANGVPQYPVARITVSYEATHYKVLSDADMVSAGDYDLAYFFATGVAVPDESALSRYTTIFTQPTTEYLGLPLGYMVWVEYNDSTNNATGDPNFGRNFYDPRTPAGFAPGDNRTYQGTPVNNTVGRLVPSTEVQIIWHMVPKLPSALYTAQGTVNSAIFSDPYGRFSAPPGCALLTQAEVKPYRWVGGKYLFDVTYKFKIFNPAPQPGDPGYPGDAFGNGVGPAGPITHNHFLHYRPGAQGVQTPPVYRLLTSNGNLPRGFPGAPAGPDGPRGPGATVYASSDFSLLFTPV